MKPIYALVIAVASAAALLLSSCTGLSSSCNAYQNQAYLDAVQPIVDRYDDAVAEARSADHESLDQHIATLQEIRREAQEVEIPNCAREDYEWFLGRMDSVIGEFAVIQSYTPTPSPPPPTPVPPPPTPTPPPTPIPPQTVETIALSGRLADPDARITGLAWYGDTLVLLPHYPSQEGGVLYAIEKADILAYLDGPSTDPLVPQTIGLYAPGIPEEVEDFDGFEAIGFAGDRVYMLFETEQDRGVVSYLVAGDIMPEENVIVLETDNMSEILAQSIIPEAGDETLLVADDLILTFYEVNELRSTPDPVAHVFDTSLRAASPIPFPNIEWRITDATALDEDNRFWVMNTSFFALELEQIVEFQYDRSGITRTDQPPIQLELESESRNWEGIARLDERGFLVVTDLDPGTILGFVPKP